MSTPAEREEANRAYLKSKVDVHLNKLIIDLLKGKPDNVMDFIHTWSGDELAKINKETMKGNTAGVEKEEQPAEPVYEVKGDALTTEDAKVEE